MFSWDKFFSVSSFIIVSVPSIISFQCFKQNGNRWRRVTLNPAFSSHRLNQHLFQSERFYIHRKFQSKGLKSWKFTQNQDFHNVSFDVFDINCRWLGRLETISPFRKRSVIHQFRSPSFNTWESQRHKNGIAWRKAYFQEWNCLKKGLENIQ